MDMNLSAKEALKDIEDKFSFYQKCRSNNSIAKTIDLELKYLIAKTLIEISLDLHAIRTHGISTYINKEYY